MSGRRCPAAYPGCESCTEHGRNAAAPVVQPPPQQRAAGGAAEGSGKAVVSGLLGSLQAELGRMTAREMMDAKALAASRSHSEAERRRRQRINGHFARLRSLLPNTTKVIVGSIIHALSF